MPYRIERVDEIVVPFASFVKLSVRAEVPEVPSAVTAPRSAFPTATARSGPQDLRSGGAIRTVVDHPVVSIGVAVPDGRVPEDAVGVPVDAVLRCRRVQLCRFQKTKRKAAYLAILASRDRSASGRTERGERVAAGETVPMQNEEA